MTSVLRLPFLGLEGVWGLLQNLLKYSLRLGFLPGSGPRSLPALASRASLFGLDRD